jgi:carbonic anhydrase
VVGVLITRGSTSGALGPLFDALPADVGVRHELERPFDPARFLPQLRSHYRYAGSLTTPPCSEGVAWFVFAQPITISDEHLARFAQRVPFDARPVVRRLR